jgi:hypothetical protein
MRKAASNFQRGPHKASGCYTCTLCRKSTRETGHEESSVGMCAYCFLRSGLENSLSDGGHTQEQFDAQLADLNNRYGRTE